MGNVGSLQQKIKFTEKTNNGIELTKENRAAKQVAMCRVLRKLGFSITQNHDVILGSFSAKDGVFRQTTPDKFLRDFITIALIKGHFQGNKGYSIPEIDKIF